MAALAVTTLSIPQHKQSTKPHQFIHSTIQQHLRNTTCKQKTLKPPLPPTILLEAPPVPTTILTFPS